MLTLIRITYLTIAAWAILFSAQILRSSFLTTYLMLLIPLIKSYFLLFIDSEIHLHRFKTIFVSRFYVPH